MPAGAFVSGAFNMYNQSQANKASAREAQKDRDFQERMAKTSYQNMVKDLEAAGLNKALAYGNTPSRVSGATASQGSATMPEPDFAGALSKRAQAKLSEAQVNSAIAQEELTRNNSEKVKTETATMLAKLPEELKVLQSTTARNHADAMGNPYKLGVDIANRTTDLLSPQVENLNRGVSSAWNAYQRNIVVPLDRQINKAVNSFSSLYNKVKERTIKAFDEKHTKRKKR